MLVRFPVSRSDLFVQNLWVMGEHMLMGGWGHAIDSKRVLPSIFNGGFERREAKAQKMLEEVVRAQGGVGGRKR